jgi:hypothetical protein
MAQVESPVICIDLGCVVTGFNEKIRPMMFKPAFLSLALFTALSVSAPTMAQEVNVLGLPAIPQPKPGTVPLAGAGASAAKNATAATAANRDAIGGELGLQHSAREGVGRLIVTTRTTFATAGARSSALDAAKLVQRELAQACAKQCKPVKMASPKILSSGQLEFELAFTPLHQHLTQAQFLAALQGKPINLTATQLQAPIQVTPPVSVSVQSSALRDAATPSAAPNSTPSK